MFKQYMHIERFGNTEVQGIELGECYIFPKLDGTNGSIWIHDEKFHAGSRKRELNIDNDNAGFYSAMIDNGPIHLFLSENENLRLFGEWLVPHTLKTYKNDAWHKFYVFDVYDDSQEKYIHYNEYQPLLEKYNINYVPPLCIIKSATYDNLLTELNNNTFLIKDGAGIGEGIVIKNYNFVNKYGRTTWAKIVSNWFKSEHTKKLGPVIKDMGVLVEEKIVSEYINDHFVNKVYAKIVNEMEGWGSKYIPRLFNTVYYDLVQEELWDICKKYKNPTINFKTLYSLIILQIKQIKPELF